MLQLLVLLAPVPLCLVVCLWSLVVAAAVCSWVPLGDVLGVVRDRALVKNLGVPLAGASRLAGELRRAEPLCRQLEPLVVGLDCQPPWAP